MICPCKTLDGRLIRATSVSVRDDRTKWSATATREGKNPPEPQPPRGRATRFAFQNVCLISRLVCHVIIQLQPSARVQTDGRRGRERRNGTDWQMADAEDPARPTARPRGKRAVVNLPLEAEAGGDPLIIQTTCQTRAAPCRHTETSAESGAAGPRPSMVCRLGLVTSDFGCRTNLETSG